MRKNIIVGWFYLVLVQRTARLFSLTWSIHPEFLSWNYKVNVRYSYIYWTFYSLQFKSLFLLCLSMQLSTFEAQK